MAAPAIAGIFKMIGGLFGKGGGKSGGGGGGIGGGVAGMAIGAGQSIMGAIKAKKAEGMGPALVDPNQQAMANMTARMLRANMTGTNNMAAMKQGAALAKTIGDKSIYSGARSMSPVMDMINKNAANMAAVSAQERTGLLGALVSQKQDIADRKMDLQGLRQSKMEAKAEKLKKAGNANLMAGLAKTMSPLSKSGGGGGGASSGGSKGGGGFTPNLGDASNVSNVWKVFGGKK